jgi:hypothetical protein
MAKSRFANFGSTLRQAREADAAEAEAVQETPIIPPASATTPAAPRGVGKRRNPDFRPTSLVLNRKTQLRATRKLQDHHLEERDLNIKDFSELVNALLEQWLSEK